MYVLLYGCNIAWHYYNSNNNNNNIYNNNKLYLYSTFHSKQCS